MEFWRYGYMFSLMHSFLFYISSCTLLLQLIICVKLRALQYSVFQLQANTYFSLHVPSISFVLDWEYWALISPPPNWNITDKFSHLIVEFWMPTTLALIMCVCVHTSTCLLIINIYSFFSAKNPLHGSLDGVVPDPDCHSPSLGFDRCGTFHVRTSLGFGHCLHHLLWWHHILGNLLPAGHPCILLWGK